LARKVEDDHQSAVALGGVVLLSQPEKPSDELLTPAEAAQKLHVKKNTLAVWRCHKRYPLCYVKIGSKVFYRQREIDRFIEAGNR
jgi:hypothetical protein